MATIEELRDALAARVEALDGVRATQEWGGPVNVSGAAMVAVVEYDGTDYDSVMSQQGDGIKFKITLLASKVSDRAGRTKLDAANDPTPGSATSLRVAVNGSLGGLVPYATVTSASEYREYPLDGQDYLGCEFGVVVAT